MDREHIEIRRLTPKDAFRLSRLLLSAPPEYSQFFTPFNFDRKHIQGILARACRDLYYGVFVEKTLAGFYMLRGLDQGFKIPSYGVWISPSCSRRGLATLTLAHALAVCKMNDIAVVMLKVHPQNTAAKALYERFGFIQIGVDPANQSLVFEKKFLSGSQRSCHERK